ncbi:unnamed protein product [Schistocephalus solidus]|uniref:U1 small nuclear ribonucleoprotein C n=1 Tax=Schistocephalus solidus TaxID=70667 RepID=A0A183T5B1_SCHSO|nr:unnamed protein product [Schistocephalus solidus]
MDGPLVEVFNDGVQFVVLASRNAEPAQYDRSSSAEAYKQGKVPPPMFGAAMGIPPPGIQNAGMPSYPPGFPPLMSVPPLGMRPPPPQGMVPGMRIPLGAQMPPAWAPGPGGMPPMPMPGAPLPPAHLPASGIHPLMSAPGLPPMGPPQ